MPPSTQWYRLIQHSTFCIMAHKLITLATCVVCEKGSVPAVFTQGQYLMFTQSRRQIITQKFYGNCCKFPYLGFAEAVLTCTSCYGRVGLLNFFIAKYSFTESASTDSVTVYLVYFALRQLGLAHFDLFWKFSVSCHLYM